MLGMNGKIPQLFDCWADPVVHLLLLKSSMDLAYLLCPGHGALLQKEMNNRHGQSSLLMGPVWCSSPATKVLHARARCHETELKPFSFFFLLLRTDSKLEKTRCCLSGTFFFMLKLFNTTAPSLSLSFFLSLSFHPSLSHAKAQ